MFVVLSFSEFFKQLVLVGLRGKRVTKGGCAVIKLLLKSLAFDKLGRVGDVDRILDFLIGSFHVAVEDIFLDRVVEKCRLLHDEAHSSTKLGKVEVLHVNAIDQHLAEIRVVEAHNQTDKRRLALAGLTNDSDVVLGVDLEVKALEDPLVSARWVSEPNILEFDLSSESCRVDLNVLGWVCLEVTLGLLGKRIDLRGCFGNLENFLGCGFRFVCIRTKRACLPGRESTKHHRE